MDREVFIRRISSVLELPSSSSTKTTLACASTMLRQQTPLTFLANHNLNCMLISTNIIRDEDLEFDYIVTENTQRIFNELIEASKRGKCFNLIGSYGTGKSSFLVAFEQTVLGKRVFLNRRKRPRILDSLS